MNILEGEKVHDWAAQTSGVAIAIKGMIDSPHNATELGLYGLLIILSDISKNLESLAQVIEETQTESDGE